MILSKRNIHAQGTALLHALSAALAALAVLALCATAHARQTVHLGYSQWNTDIVSTNLIKAIIETRLGRKCEIHLAEEEVVWGKIATGEFDGMVCAWLPVSQNIFYQANKDNIEDLGPNLLGVRNGLVIPEYVATLEAYADNNPQRKLGPIKTIGDLAPHKDKFKGLIFVTRPNAGPSLSTLRAIKAYELEGFTVVYGTEDSMVQELSESIKRRDWIVVAGWVPHWMFQVWKLRMLDDPKKVFGTIESVHTIVRNDLKRDMPDVYKFLDQFSWNLDDIGTLLTWLDLDHGRDPYDKALRWMSENPKRIESWLVGVKHD